MLTQIVKELPKRIKRPLKTGPFKWKAKKIWADFISEIFAMTKNKTINPNEFITAYSKCDEKTQQVLVQQFVEHACRAAHSGTRNEAREVLGIVLVSHHNKGILALDNVKKMATLQKSSFREAAYRTLGTILKTCPELKTAELTVSLNDTAKNDGDKTVRKAARWARDVKPSDPQKQSSYKGIRRFSLDY